MLIASRSATAVMSNLSAARYMVGFSGVQGLSRWSVPGSNRQTFEILKGVPEERALLHEVEEAARQNDQIANAYYGDEMLPAAVERFVAERRSPGWIAEEAERARVRPAPSTL